MKRTPHDQAFLAYLDSIDHPNGIGSRYAQVFGMIIVNVIESSASI